MVSRCCISVLLIFFFLLIISVRSVNVTECAQKWDCTWEKDFHIVRTEGTCTHIPYYDYPISGPPAVGPPGPCDLLVLCYDFYGSSSSMFECINVLSGDAEIKTLHLYRCNSLQITENDLAYFTSLEAFYISYASIQSIHDRAFYRMRNLTTIDIYQDYYGSGIFEYPKALIGPDGTYNSSFSDPPTAETHTVFLPKLEDLFIQNFLFRSGIPDNAFQNLQHLKRLTFAHVSLANSDFESMKRLSNLIQLEIYDSPFIDVLPASLSSSMPNLFHLSISMTSISNITNQLAHFTLLQTLTLTDNLLTYIAPHEFETLTNLSSLDLYGNTYLQDIPNIQTLARLRYLDLSFCSVSNLSSEVFSNSDKLQVIRLRGNKFTEIPKLFENVPKSLVSLKNIEIIDVSKNEIFVVRSYIFSNLPKVKLIDLSFNKITSIEEKAFFNLENIVEIQLDYNEITMMDPLALCYINSLQHLDLKYNKLANFPKFPYNANWSPGHDDLPENPFRTDLRGNPLTCDCNMFRDMFVLVGKHEWSLPYTYGQIWPGNYLLSNQRFDKTVLYCDTAFNGKQRIDDMLHLPSAFFSFITSTEECPAPCNCFRQCDDDLLYAVCNSGNLTSTPTGLNSETNLLSIRNNSIVKLTTASFSHLPNLVSVDLSDNFIQDIEPGTFADFQYLRTLILDGNNLTHLDSRSLNVSSPKFRILHLTSNYISSMANDTFRFVPSLTRLELADNSLTGLPTGIFDNLQNLSYLTVSGNPFNCSCDILYLTDWYKETVFELQRNLWTDVTELECAPFLNETELFDWVEQKELICNPPPTSVSVTKIVAKENPLRWTVWGSGVGSAIFLTSVICGMIYKFRLEILVLIYIKTGLKLPSNNSDDEGKEYDAFISFSSLDRDFVLEELVPNLEGNETHRKLCIHHRDFVVGECIATNIVNAIENSKRIVILCSQNYLQSEWCSYEFKTSHQQALRDRTRRIILIMMEDVQKKSLDKEIKAYVSTNTYLDRKDPLFWSKLAYSVPESKPNEKILDGENMTRIDTCDADVITNANTSTTL
ncbi:Toll-like receptor Tollo [Holothuria leucospilota]|uniref:Toll-like receptor Tollo n=1 Tax=Holothuria leucospilota TaxID=206669 RepID=A0A9Q1H2Z3_HOLLE|nr:Toll-like receptor Tollo [Holothuria leucospilota]